MNHQHLTRQLELEQQLDHPWDWDAEYYPEEHSWEHTRPFRNKYAMELAKEFGPITIPHKTRRQK